MDKKVIEEQIIKNYQADEKMMILIYAQWCVNNEIDPLKLYGQAYPHQVKNNALKEALELTVPRSESEEISAQAVLNVLQLFGNDDLAFLVQEEIEKRERK
ncbi:hypothetical protein [Oceanobacillus bengalensis]|uniref:Uncharacterized protein n=1 Tax=Oceanobacillus bengalensis TaxID=1435466 RepID=A0A494YSB7_9BACI|nr:hypothetical protein [Oceanobacillus bengalensis]RKQ12835.1 hypothetical protein D8M05_17655 [Oceanobacillus bengalensis]